MTLRNVKRGKARLTEISADSGDAELREAQRRAAEHSVFGRPKDTRALAEHLGVTPAAMRLWLRDPHYVSWLDHYCDLAVADHERDVKRSLSLAVHALRSVAANPRAKPTARIKAAQALLQAAEPYLAQERGEVGEEGRDLEGELAKILRLDTA